MKVVLLLVVPMICLATDPSIVADTISDEFEQYVQIRTINGELYGNSHNEQVFLDIAKYTDASGVTYLLIVEYVGSEILSIRDGISLFIKYGDSLMSLESRASSYRMSYSFGMGIVRETAHYPVEKAQLRRIASAKSGKIKIKGWNKDLVRLLGNKNFLIIRRFVDTYVE